MTSCFSASAFRVLLCYHGATLNNIIKKGVVTSSQIFTNFALCRATVYRASIMACAALVRALDEDDDAQKDSLLDEEASCGLMLEALQEHLRSIEVRINLA